MNKSLRRHQVKLTLFERIKICQSKIILNFITIFYILKNTIYANWPIKKLNYQIYVKDYSSYLVKPKGNTKGIIFIIHDWNGLNKYEKSRADMLAEEGYIG